MSGKDTHFFSIKKGANLHGFVNRLHSNTNKMNVPKKVKKLIIKTGEYSVKLPHLNKESEIDKKIEDMEYDYIDDMLQMNEQFKHQ